MNQQATVQTPKQVSHTSPNKSGVLQRKCACGQHTSAGGEYAECKKKRMKLQRSATNQANPTTVPPIVHEVLRSPGQPLDAATRAFMEPRFGHDFSQVRVHTDTKAAESAHGVNALTYTVGHNIVFNIGHYAPTTNSGRRLLAHELTHVVQQRSAPQVTRPASLAIMPADHPSEIEAQRTSQHVLAGPPIQKPISHQVAAIQRQADPAPAQSNQVEDDLLDKIWQGIEGIPEGIMEGVEDISKGIIRGIRCGLPATEDPLINPLSDMSTFQSPGGSGWRGAIFGCYRNNCTRRHRGWDIHASVNTPVRAVVEGTMSRHNNPGGYGQYVRLHSSKNPDRRYVYAHLSRREPTGNYCVGDKLGETGTTGNASANRPHLHFEVHTSNVAQDPAGLLTEPSQVVGVTGSAPIPVNKSVPAPCVSC